MNSAIPPVWMWSLRSPVPKLRAAKHEKERGVLQNAVDSTDRKIDELVYELYALTPDEIALVEGTAK